MSAGTAIRNISKHFVRMPFCTISERPVASTAYFKKTLGLVGMCFVT